MDYTVSLQVQHQLTVFPTHLYQGYSLELQMKSTEVDQGLFTDTYCKVCSAQLISESQRVAHYESRKHANKVRLYYMLHPVDGGCPAKKLRTDNGSEEGDVDKNKCCTLCNMSFTSAVVAQSHYQGKIHAKRLKLLLGEQPAITAKEAPPSPVKSSPETTPLTSPRQRRDSDRYCQLCNAWFNNPGMAQQHYDGKKHKKNAARADLLEQLGKTLDMGEMKGLKRSYTCEVCSVTLNSVAQYHAHLQGSKHQNKSWMAGCLAPVMYWAGQMQNSCHMQPDAIDDAAVELFEDLGTHAKSFQSPEGEKVLLCPPLQPRR
ncbi:zinc finger matrin-type protein 4 isoform X1 [Oncorhynchus nerka]|uniref:zinc finger matrin-type protein 4 isoform X1 n=1 Tax=Oncorhynchus nerka TaxID=8023 RepID=UPI0011318A42|nr:zinc finger matrin-type protein 4-like isoform X1 [Oncorhynchus nerka]